MVWFLLPNGEQPIFDCGYEAEYEAAKAADATGQTIPIYDVYSEKAPYRQIQPGQTATHAKAYADNLRKVADDDVKRFARTLFARKSVDAQKKAYELAEAIWPAAPENPSPA